MTEPLNPPSPRRWGVRILLVLFGAVVLPVVVTLLYTYPPTDAGTFYPGCMFYTISNKLGYALHCPGCGATRSSHSLLHGEFAQAFAWNPLFVILLPLIVYSAGRSAYTAWTGKPAPGYRLPMWTAKVLLWTVLAYWIARNIPVEPFNLLAPHAI